MGNQIQHTVVRVTTTGSAGSATGTATSNVLVTGTIEAVYLDYHASAPATTDVTVKTSLYNILAKADSATDTYYAPRKGAVDAAAAAITGSFVPIVAADRITVDVAQSNALTDCVVAHIYWRD